MDAIETIERDGYVGRIFRDESFSNPRQEFDHVGLLVQLEPYYEQPDAKDWRADALVDAWERYNRDVEKVERFARAFLNAVAVTWWDSEYDASRVIGIIDREDAAREGITDPLACIVSEVEEYAAFATGDVYGYTVENAHRGDVDSCWGYYGDRELPYIRECIERAIADDQSALAWEA